MLFSKFAWVKDDQRTQLLRERIAGGWCHLKKIYSLYKHARAAKIIITANTSPLSGKDLLLKESLEVILENPDTDSKVQHVLVYKRTNKDVPMKPGRDEWLEEVYMANFELS